MVALVTTIVPKVALPLTTPSTSQTIWARGAAQSNAVKDCTWPITTLADDGEIELVPEQVMVTTAVPVFVGSAVLVAATVTFGGAGTAVGAV